MPVYIVYSFFGGFENHSGRVHKSILAARRPRVSQVRRQLAKELPDIPSDLLHNIQITREDVFLKNNYIVVDNATKEDKYVMAYRQRFPPGSHFVKLVDPVQARKNKTLYPEGFEAWFKNMSSVADSAKRSGQPSLLSKAFENAESLEDVAPLFGTTPEDIRAIKRAAQSLAEDFHTRQRVLYTTRITHLEDVERKIEEAKLKLAEAFEYVLNGSIDEALQKIGHPVMHSVTVEDLEKETVLEVLYIGSRIEKAYKVYIGADSKGSVYGPGVYHVCLSKYRDGEQVAIMPGELDKVHSEFGLPASVSKTSVIISGFVCRAI